MFRWLEGCTVCATAFRKLLIRCSLPFRLNWFVESSFYQLEWFWILSGIQRREEGFLLFLYNSFVLYLTCFFVYYFNHILHNSFSPIQQLLIDLDFDIQVAISDLVKMDNLKLQSIPTSFHWPWPWCRYPKTKFNEKMTTTFKRPFHLLSVTRFQSILTPPHWCCL